MFVDLCEYGVSNLDLDRMIPTVNKLTVGLYKYYNRQLGTGRTHLRKYMSVCCLSYRHSEIAYLFVTFLLASIPHVCAYNQNLLAC